MTRIEKLTPEDMTDDQRRAYQSIIASRTPEGMTADQANTYREILGTEDQKFNLGGPFNAVLRSPNLAAKIADLGSFFRFGTRLPPRWVELAILTTARFWTAHYEWHAHARFAREAGLEPSVIDAIKANERPDFTAREDEVVYEICTQLHRSHQISDPTYTSAVAVLGEGGVVELIGLIGFYTLVSMTLNTFQVQVPEGSELPPN